MNDHELTELLSEIFEDAYNSTSILPISRRLISRYTNRLNEVDYRELLLCCFRDFESDEAIGLVTTTPEFWNAWNFSAWINISLELYPRRKYNVYEPNGYYSDIILFHKYLNLDLANNLLRNNKLLAHDRGMIQDFCIQKAEQLMYNPDEMDDFDGVVMCELKFIEEYRSKLIRENDFLLPAYNCDPEEFTQMIRRAG
jgi:hypothetical protein